MEKKERTGLGIPELHLTIERRTEEPRSIVVERHISHTLRMTHERSQTFSFVIHIPKLSRLVSTALYYEGGELTLIRLSRAPLRSK